jgi:hypothetical protein
MAEFYKYEKRDYKDAPNWAKISGDISDDLTKISDTRQKQRLKNEEDLQKALTELNEDMSGSNQDMNQMVQKGSRDAAEYLLEQNKLMKQNKINPEQNMAALQVQQDDWKTFKGVVTNWNADYADYMTRMETETSAGMERAMAGWNEEFGNISNKEVVPGGKNGRLILITRNEDGTVNTDSDKMISVNVLNNRIKDRVDKYDVNAAVNNQVKKFGEMYNVINKDGILSEEDVRNNPEFKTAKAKMVKSLMGTPRQMSSILSENVGDYSFTKDPEMQGKEDENGKEMILLEPDDAGLFQPNFTGEQEEAARKYVDMQLEMQMGHKETAKVEKTYSGGSGSSPTERATRKTEIGLFQTAMDIVGGDLKAIDRVIEDENSGVSNIAFNSTDNTWTIQFDDFEKGKAIVPSTGDPVEDAKAILKYTVGETYTKKYGAQLPVTLYDQWKRRGVVQDISEVSLGDIEKMAAIRVSELTYGDQGASVFDKMELIRQGSLTPGATPQSVVSQIENLLQTTNLPGGVGGRDIRVTGVGKDIVIRYKGKEWKTTADNAPIGVKNALQAIVDLEIANYNANTTPTGGTSRG